MGSTLPTAVESMRLQRNAYVCHRRWSCTPSPIRQTIELHWAELAYTNPVCHFRACPSFSVNFSSTTAGPRAPLSRNDAECKSTAKSPHARSRADRQTTVDCVHAIRSRYCRARTSYSARARRRHARIAADGKLSLCASMLDRPTGVRHVSQSRCKENLGRETICVL